jgi:glycosyltransferase involved in cell wall biosynthesis
VLATDRSLVDVVLRHLPVPRQRVPVVPNAIDLARVDRLAADAPRDLRERHAIPPTAAVLLSVGRLEENKGYHVLAEALGSLASATVSPGARDWRWVLVGDGPFRARLASLASARGVASRMIMPGRVDEPTLHGWYAAASAFVHPTLYEGSSLVTLEAMAHGRAVVATRAGGLPDKVNPGVTGWLVPPGDVRALAGAIRETLATGARLDDMGRAGRAVVEREFDWPAVTSRLLAIYDDVLRARP